MDLLVHAIEDLELKGVKFGPIYNGVSLLDPGSSRSMLPGAKQPAADHAYGHHLRRQRPVALGRPVDVDTIANRHPDLKMIMAHMAHPWYEECIVVARKNPNVYCEVSALYYRRWQFWNILICAQEYQIALRDKIFWGTDFPFTTVQDSIAGLRDVNRVVEDPGFPWCRARRSSGSCNPIRGFTGGMAATPHESSALGGGAMKIAAVEPILLRGDEAYRSGAGAEEATDNGDWQLLVRVATDEGLTGWADVETLGRRRSRSSPARACRSSDSARSPNS